MPTAVDVERRERLSHLDEAEKLVLRQFAEAGFEPQRMKAEAPVVRRMIMAEMLLPPARPAVFDWDFAAFEGQVSMRQWVIEALRSEPDLAGKGEHRGNAAK